MRYEEEWNRWLEHKRGCPECEAATVIGPKPALRKDIIARICSVGKDFLKRLEKIAREED